MKFILHQWSREDMARRYSTNNKSYENNIFNGQFNMHNSYCFDYFFFVFFRFFRLIFALFSLKLIFHFLVLLFLGAICIAWVLCEKCLFTVNMSRKYLRNECKNAECTVHLCDLWSRTVYLRLPNYVTISIFICLMIQLYNCCFKFIESIFTRVVWQPSIVEAFQTCHIAAINSSVFGALSRSHFFVQQKNVRLHNGSRRTYTYIHNKCTNIV